MTGKNLLPNLACLGWIFFAGCVLDWEAKSPKDTGDTLTDTGDTLTDTGDTGSDTNTNSDEETDACPGDIEFLSAAVFTETIGDKKEALQYLDSCPAGQVVVGFQGFLHEIVNTAILQVHGRIQAICGSLSISLKDNGCLVTIQTGTTLPLRGTTGNIEWSRICPENEMIVGFRGKAGADIDQFTFRCAPLLITHDTSGYDAARGTSTDLAKVGGGGGQNFSQADCPTGQLATISNTHADSLLRAFALGCQSPSLQN